MWWFLGAALSCGVADYVPVGPSLSASGEAWWLSRDDEPVEYTGGAALAEAPILPFQLFALTYEDDIVIETEHPDWAMHEYARIELDGRSYWLAKDADRSGVQTVTASLEGLTTWLPEIPVPRHYAPVEVEDRSTDARLDVSLRYENARGERVEVDFAADRPARIEPKRNGSTFDHSRDVASVVLDIPGRQLSGVEASVRYDGEEASIRRVLGLAPVAALLDQTQAGFAVASMRLYPDGDGISIVRPIPGDPWEAAGRERCAADGDAWVCGDGARSVRYEMPGGELTGASVEVEGVEILRLHLSGPLPDLRRPFYGWVRRSFTLSVNGQTQGHGAIVASWSRGAPWVRVEPAAPRWFAARPILSEVRFTGDGGAELRSTRD